MKYTLLIILLLPSLVFGYASSMSAGRNKIENGTSKVEIASADGEVAIDVNSNQGIEVKADSQLYVYERTGSTAGGTIKLAREGDNDIVNAILSTDSAYDFNVQNNLGNLKLTTTTSGKGINFTTNAGAFSFSNGTATSITIGADNTLFFNESQVANLGTYMTLYNDGGASGGAIYKSSADNLVFQNSTSGSDIQLTATGTNSNIVASTVAGTGNVPFGRSKTIESCDNTLACSATCPTGKYAISCGCVIGTGPVAPLFNVYESTGGAATGTCQCNWTGSTPVLVYAHAICVYE